MSNMTRLFRVFVLAAALLGLSAPTTASADYGSGVLGDYTKYSHCDTGCRGVNTTNSRYVYSASWDTAEVGLAGDSTVARAWGDVVPIIAARGKTGLAVNYWSGRPTAPLVDWLIQRVQAGKRIPPVLIIASGSNDIYSPVGLAAQIRRLKAALPSSVTLFWVDIQVSRTKYSQAVQIADQRNSMALNQQIYTTMDYSRVIRWSELFWSAPWRLSYYLDDGVHQKVGVGTRCWAAAITAPVINQGML